MKSSPFSGNEPALQDIQPEPPIAFHAEPELMWASISEEYGVRESDSAIIPKYPLIKTRSMYCDSGPLGLGAFWKTIISSRRLWILDPHFGKEELATLNDYLELAPALSNFHLITTEKGVRKAFQSMRKVLEEKHRLTPDATFGITEIDRRKSCYLHDRFAVTDDELWHFGGTVGCLEKDMTAVSRGWDARKREFIVFFEEIRRMNSPEGALRQ